MEIPVENNLKNHLDYWLDNIPFFKHLKISKKNIENNWMEIFEDLPILSKSDYRYNFSFFINNKYNLEISHILENEYKKLCSYNTINKAKEQNDPSIVGKFDKEYLLNDRIKLFLEQTSGSTGEPLYFIKSQKYRFLLAKTLWDFRRMVDPYVSPFSILNFMHRNRKDTTLKYLKYEFAKNRREHLKYLFSLPFSWWHILPERLQKYVTFLEKNTFDFSNSLKVIESNGQFLTKDIAIKCKKYFNCHIVNNYGCREVWTIGYSTINDHSTFCINSNLIYLELIDDNKKVIKEPNKEGRIVVTGLHNKLMPFVRYTIGDIGKYVMSDKNKFMLKIIEGRMDERIKGTNIYGNVLFSNILKKIGSLYNLVGYEYIEIIQKGINSFIVNIYNSHMNNILFEREFTFASKERLGNRNNFQFIYHNRIENTDINQKIFTCVI